MVRERSARNGGALLISGAQIFNTGRNSKKKENNKKEVNKAHSPHHSHRHVGHLHYAAIL
jgi:hypothetical protein